MARPKKIAPLYAATPEMPNGFSPAGYQGPPVCPMPKFQQSPGWLPPVMAQPAWPHQERSSFHQPAYQGIPMSNIMSQASVHKTLFLLEQMVIRLRAETVKAHLPHNPPGDAYKDHAAQASSLGATPTDLQGQPFPQPTLNQNASFGFTPAPNFNPNPSANWPNTPTADTYMRNIGAAQIAAMKPAFTAEQVTDIEKEVSDLATKFFND